MNKYKLSQVKREQINLSIARSPRREEPLCLLGNRLTKTTGNLLVCLSVCYQFPVSLLQDELKISEVQSAESTEVIIRNA